MRRVRKIVGTLALTLTVAMSCMQGATVFAADGSQVVADDSIASDSTTTSVDGDTSTDTTSATNDGDITDSNNTSSSDHDATNIDGTTTDITATATADGATADTTGAVTADGTTADTTGAATADGATTDTAGTVTATDTTTVTKEEAILYLSDNINNCYDGISQKTTISLTGTLGEEASKFFKFNMIGAFTTHIDDKQDLTSWCTGLPDSFSLIKYSSNTVADYGRVQVVGVATTHGEYEVTLTIPSDYYTLWDNYQVSEDGLSVTFYLNFDGLVVPVTVPTEEVQSAGHHSSTKKAPVLSDYAQFCNEVAAQVTNAEANEEITVSTDKWVSFNKKVIDALAARQDVTLKLDFVYDNQNYQTVINPGEAEQLVVTKTYTLDTNALNGEVGQPAETVADTTETPEYYGFLYVGSKFGMNTVTE